MKRFKYHFEPKYGWMNDPNGLIYFKGKYHAFFQHNPIEPKWGPMHWGHAVSDDLIHWDFDGEKFFPKSFQPPENGPQFYAPQTFRDNNGRRILIAWFYNWEKKPNPKLTFAGALTIPREVKIADGKIRLFPVGQAHHLLSGEDKSVKIYKDKVIMLDSKRLHKLRYDGIVESVHILRDEKALEVFINKGEASYSYWI